MAVVTGSCELFPRRIDLIGSPTIEGQRGSVTTGPRWRPGRVERPDRFLGVERDSDAPEVNVDVCLPVDIRRDRKAESTVEGQCRSHVGDDEFDNRWAQPHGGHGNHPPRSRLGRFGHQGIKPAGRLKAGGLGPADGLRRLDVVATPG